MTRRQNNVVIVKGDYKLQMVNGTNRQLQRTVRMDILEKVQSSLLALHPSVVSLLSPES